MNTNRHECGGENHGSPGWHEYLGSARRSRVGCGAVAATFFLIFLGDSCAPQSGLLSYGEPDATDVGKMFVWRLEMRCAFILWLVYGAVLFSSSARAQSDNSAGTAEMARLARVLAGDWNTVEIVQHGKPVPEGAGRRGTVHVTLVGGGTALVSEGHSVGAIGGDLRWFITIWWDAGAKLYRFLTCFKTPADAGCELRGTAHWDGDTFVNDYEEVINGKRTRIQDRWTDITPNSHTLTEAHDTGNGVMKPYVVSHSTRQ